MKKKSIGLWLLIAGALLLIVSLAADALGIGQAPVFGYKQIIGVIAGVALAALGSVLAFRK